jgi:hypothetical protein
VSFKYYLLGLRAKPIHQGFGFFPVVRANCVMVEFNPGLDD